jgi:hypothetical protein
MVSRLKLSEVLQLDTRIKGNKRLLVDKLMELPMFADKLIQPVTMEILEDLMWKIMKKYPVQLSYIMAGPTDERYYSIMIKERETHKHLKTIHCHTIFEGFAKTVLYLYAYCKRTYKKGEE